MKKTYHVSHILVTHDYEAQDIIRKIQEGKSFEEMALKFSKCSSAKRMGDLGPIPVGAADEDFEEAAMALKTGEWTQKPIRTKFGYHIIKKQ